MSLTLIGTELDLPFEDLFRVVAYLERNGYLFARASDQSICITPNGVLYIEQQAHRRQSVRAAVRPPAHPRRPDLDEPRAG